MRRKPNSRTTKYNSNSNSRYPYKKSNAGYSRNRYGSSKRYNRDERIDHARYISKAQGGQDESIYVENLSYENFGLSEVLVSNLATRNFVHPTKIQASVIPLVTEGNDVLALAQTGSGKTAAFLIPLINKALSDRSQKCLIVVPTRELANQIKNEFDLFSAHTGLRRVLVIGGENVRRQIFEVRKNPEFIIGTPGRLLDLYERKELKLGKVNAVVLDEVDRMLDMGFIDEIKELISVLNSTRQSIFLSATMSTAALQIAETLLKDPIKVQAESQSPIKNVEQRVVKSNLKGTKIETLHDILIQKELKKVLIFSKTKKGADVLSQELKVRGFKVDSIHGDKTQHTRTKVLASFRKDVIKILIATDVASRGIDIPDISHVINYDEPSTYSDYIHRIGRTGRIGKKGVALTFVK